MKPQKAKLQIITASLMTALMVGVINASSAYIAYSFLVPDEAEVTTESLISSTASEVETQQDSANQPDAAITNPDTVIKNITPTPATVRNTNSAIVVGQAAQPTKVTTDSSGNVKYQWCSGTNPNLDDAVCEAIISIASDPTSSNPHLGSKAVQSLSLLPKDITLTLHEETWESDVSHYGTMIITANTKEYGNIDLKVALEKINNVWVIQDGYLA